MRPTDLADFSAVALIQAYQRGDASPVEATQAVFSRLHSVNESLNAYVHWDEAAALEAAASATDRWRRGAPLSDIDGIPVSIKDLLDVTGWPTRKGSRSTSPDPALQDAPAVARLRQAGAVLSGKTATSEYGWKCVTDSPLTGITRNPRNIDMTPGGSSGGAAAAAAAGIGPLHLGTDGAGSLRLPASFCGVVGFKPTFGMVPHAPPAHTGDLFHAGPIARTVTDAALMMSVLSPPGPELPSGFLRTQPGPPRRVACVPSLDGTTVDPDISESLFQAADVFKDSGTIVTTLPPLIDSVRACFDVLWCVGAARLFATLSDAQRPLLEPGLTAMAEKGASFSQTTIEQARTARRKATASIQATLDAHDLIILPTLPIGPFKAGCLTPPGSQFRSWLDWTPFTYPFNMTQMPAVSLPYGENADGMPIGLQIVGPKSADARVLAAAEGLATTAF